MQAAVELGPATGRVGFEYARVGVVQQIARRVEVKGFHPERAVGLQQAPHRIVAVLQRAAPQVADAGQLPRRIVLVLAAQHALARMGALDV
ncbi:hypothetical protein FQZ97_1120210 [compost metagenome]